jgi:hypothetical protein
LGRAPTLALCFGTPSHAFFRRELVLLFELLELKETVFGSVSLLAAAAASAPSSARSGVCGASNNPSASNDLRRAALIAPFIFAAVSAFAVHEGRDPSSLDCGSTAAAVMAAPAPWANSAAFWANAAALARGVFLHVGHEA